MAAADRRPATSLFAVPATAAPRAESGERFATVGEVELCYQTFGDPADPTVLLVMGLGTQMIAWHEDFCALLVERGLHVVRFDNRDVGRSTHLTSAAPPTPLELLTRRPRRLAYTLADMARDAVGLLDHLGVVAAHAVGASMGGMIAQLMAANHRDRILSLASVMSSTGERFSGQPALRVYPFFLRRPPRTREAYAERMVALFGVVGSPGFPFDVEHLRDVAERSFDRGLDQAGTARQLAAIFASGSRVADLRRITAPTVVIHGTADRLVGPSGGVATARAIPGARLVLVEGMGHDLPRGAWPQIVGAIHANGGSAASEASG